MKIKIKIRRCDPLSADRYDTYIQAYTVEVAEGMTVLEALLKIADEDDPTLSFRRSCRSAICGSCAMNINGFPKLACRTQLAAEYRKRGEVILEPLGNFKVIKDLVVDMDPFWKKIEKVSPYLTSGGEPPEGGWSISRDEAARIDASQRCIMCGSCNASCNATEVDERYIGPSALAKAWRFVGDVRDANAERRLERLSEEHGMWDCVRCYHCTEYCPKEVSPLRAIEELRARAMEYGITENEGARHVEALVDSVRRVGRLDEAAMTFKTLGFLRSLGMIPFGLKMELHGKMPHPIIFPAIEGIDEVRAICKAVEAKKRGE
ncbi:MAG TPA: succinate dehydrogenase/fumarate reductase iron-sulfur subunit [Deltaproteobacteria bacterium]|nr:succinate dehydrogenase/fumarate reductase iron-sulfur subunit [Deltaproteobacteria bacterium]